MIHYCTFGFFAWFYTNYGNATGLRVAAHNQFGAVRNTRTGIAEGSCCAAVAVDPTAEFPALPGYAFGVVYGNSRIAAAGLDQGDLAGHAERCALTAVDNHGLTLWTSGNGNHVLFVELEPCDPCKRWLSAAGANAGPQNPFGPGLNLEVWYSLAYPAGAAQMVQDHRQGVMV